MEISIEAISINPQRANSVVPVNIPSTCPSCGTSHGHEPLVSYICKSKLGYDTKKSYVYSLYFCPACDRCFYVTYRVWVSGYGGNDSEIVEILPVPFPTQYFSEKIKELSPKFIEIYQQSKIAEDAGLSEICGMGYRKALEFLVKDYAIAFHPEDEEKIKSQMLSQCINAYIKDPDMKSLAIASTWLGNDETHYVRKHEDYDLESLKAFVATTVAAVDYDLTCREAKKLIDPLNQVPSIH